MLANLFVKDIIQCMTSPEEGESVFTRSEIERVLAARLGETGLADALEALDEFDSARQVEVQNQARIENIKGMCAANTRAYGTDSTKPSMSGIEGWHDELDEYAVKVLNDCYGRDDLSELEVEARDLAALVHTLHESYAGGFDLEEDLFKQCGVNVGRIIEVFRNKFNKEINPTDKPETQQQIREIVQNLKDISKLVMHAPQIHEIYKGALDNLGKKLKDLGVELPELGSDGLYDEERKDEEALDLLD